MSTEASIQQLARIFEESCLELFTGFNCQIQKTDDAMPEGSDDPVAMVDAGSPELEIAVILRLPVNILALTYPSGAEITQISEEVLEDWIAEISNQLIGKIKNKLLNYGVRLTLGLPNAYFGVDMADLITEGRHSMVTVFDIDHELLEVVLVVDVLDDTMDLTTPPQDDEGPGGGELELF